MSFTNPQIKLFFGRASQGHSFKARRSLLASQTSALYGPAGTKLLAPQEGWNRAARAKLLNRHLQVESKLFSFDQVLRAQDIVSQELGTQQQFLPSADAPLESKEAFLIHTHSLMASGRLFLSPNFIKEPLDRIHEALPGNALDSLLGESEEAAKSYVMMLANDWRDFYRIDCQHSMQYLLGNLERAQLANQRYLEGAHGSSAYSERLQVQELALRSELMSWNEFEGRSRELLAEISCPVQRARLQTHYAEELLNVDPRQGEQVLEEAKAEARAAFGSELVETETWQRILNLETEIATRFKPKEQFLASLERLRAARSEFAELPADQDYFQLSSEASLLAYNFDACFDEQRHVFQNLITLYDDKFPGLPFPSNRSFHLWNLLTPTSMIDTYTSPPPQLDFLVNALQRLENEVTAPRPEGSSAEHAELTFYADLITPLKVLYRSCQPSDQATLERQLKEVQASQQNLKEAINQEGSALSHFQFPSEILELAELQLLYALGQEEPRSVKQTLFRRKEMVGQEPLSIYYLYNLSLINRLSESDELIALLKKFLELKPNKMIQSVVQFNDFMKGARNRVQNINKISEQLRVKITKRQGLPNELNLWYNKAIAREVATMKKTINEFIDKELEHLDKGFQPSIQNFNILLSVIEEEITCLGLSRFQVQLMDDSLVNLRKEIRSLSLYDTLLEHDVKRSQDLPRFKMVSNLIELLRAGLHLMTASQFLFLALIGNHPQARVQEYLQKVRTDMKELDLDRLKGISSISPPNSEDGKSLKEMVEAIELVQSMLNTFPSMSPATIAKVKAFSSKPKTHQMERFMLFFKQLQPLLDATRK